MHDLEDTWIVWFETILHSDVLTFYIPPKKNILIDTKKDGVEDVSTAILGI